MDVEDEEEVEEEDGDSGVDELVGGEGGGNLLKDFKGVLRINFGTCKGTPSFVSKRGLEYIEKVSSGCSEKEASGRSKMEGK